MLRLSSELANCIVTIRNTFEARGEFSQKMSSMPDINWKLDSATSVNSFRCYQTHFTNSDYFLSTSSVVPAPNYLHIVHEATQCLYHLCQNVESKVHAEMRGF